MEKFKTTLSEYNRLMDDAVDRMLSMPETTPMESLARWQSRENLAIADMVIGPGMFEESEQ